jgi:hypothetical protein
MSNFVLSDEERTPGGLSVLWIHFCMCTGLVAWKEEGYSSDLGGSSVYFGWNYCYIHSCCALIKAWMRTSVSPCSKLLYESILIFLLLFFHHGFFNQGKSANFCSVWPFQWWWWWWWWSLSLSLSRVIADPTVVWIQLQKDIWLVIH